MKIPERTVDSMVAIEVTRLDPTSIIFSPANTSGAVDHKIRNQFVATLLECKGVNDLNKIPINLMQLWDYVYGPNALKLWYLLPSKPANSRPWDRRCAGANCHYRGTCRYCPRDKRSMIWPTSWISALSFEDQLQPWFAHWSYCVPAKDLANRFGLVKGTKSNGTKSLHWDDGKLGNLTNAVRLCHFFGRGPTSVTQGPAQVGPQIRQPGVNALSQLQSDEYEGRVPSLTVLQSVIGR